MATEQAGDQQDAEKLIASLPLNGLPGLHMARFSIQGDVQDKGAFMAPLRPQGRQLSSGFVRGLYAADKETFPS